MVFVSSYLISETKNHYQIKKEIYNNKQRYLQIINMATLFYRKNF